MSDPGNPLSDGSWQPPTPDELHAQLPLYEVLEVLGIGGMAAVYKGFQTSLERYVAIKILPPSFDEDLQYTQRFKQEAKTMARLSHTGIIGVHDCGQTKSGLLYIVMEFVEGTDIHRMIQRQGCLSAEEAMAITLHVCDALSYAHENGVVHRDIKPANIMVDTQGRVKVADFGLAKSALLGSDDSTSKIAMGTPGYVAPEALMMGVEVDRRVDVFAVGVMLYEMLTGKTPTTQSEPASVLVPGLDPRYDQVISRATRHDRDARYRNAQELKDDLIKIHTVPMSQSGLRRASHAASAPSRTPPSRTARPAAPPEPEGGFPTTLVVGVAAVLALGLFLWKPWAAKQPREEVVQSVSPPPEVTPPAAPMETPASPSQEKPAPTPVTPPIAVAPKETSAPTIPPVVPVPAKPEPSIPNPPSELDTRLGKLDQQFQAAASRDVEPGFKASVAALDKGYTGALDRALAAASQAGDLEGALAVRDEKQRLEKGQGLPPAVADKDLPASLRDLRKTYRGAYAKLEADRLKSLQPLCDKYEQALAYDESELTKVGKIDEAMRVRSLRGRIAQFRLVGDTSVLGAVSSLVVFDSAVTIPANRPNGYAIPAVKRGDSISVAYLKGQWKDHGHLATENPDRPSQEGIEKCQLVIAHATGNDQPGDVVQLVPTGTASSPFVYAVPADDEKLVLRINAHSNDSNNPGQVSYQLKITRPGAAPSVGPVSQVASPAAALTNSLGMKFVAVPGTHILMCIHETRKKDYATYAAENPGVFGSWKNPIIKGVAVTPSDDCPVVLISWEDAHAFCAWLSKKEGRTYRLPTDHEWSMAVGIGDREDPSLTPQKLNGLLHGIYPWGTEWPPPKGAGNFGDTAKEQVSNSAKEFMHDYTDGFPTTSPVMSFTPNALGIYDLSGNVWEWCEDWVDEKHQGRVLRGGAWECVGSDSLMSSCRIGRDPKSRYIFHGFRCVLEEGSETLPTPAPAKVDTPAQSTSAAAYTNSLGMKFVALPSTGILMCIHDTRHRDYAAFAVDHASLDTSWEIPRRYNVDIGGSEDDPVVYVTWDDAQAFCAWLGKKEGKTYRLPTDREWSVAVGIADREPADAAPENLDQKLASVYPWGAEWPPPQGAGNFADESTLQIIPKANIIQGYNDGHPALSPVMSFPPNQLGLYDLSGNVWQWCEDWYDTKMRDKVLRGGCWLDNTAANLLSSRRIRHITSFRSNLVGFRCVLLAGA